MMSAPDVAFAFQTSVHFISLLQLRFVVKDCTPPWYLKLHPKNLWNKRRHGQGGWMYFIYSLRQMEDLCH